MSPAVIVWLQCCCGVCYGEGADNRVVAGGISGGRLALHDDAHLAAVADAVASSMGISSECSNV